MFIVYIESLKCLGGEQSLPPVAFTYHCQLFHIGIPKQFLYPTAQPNSSLMYIVMYFSPGQGACMLLYATVCIVHGNIHVLYATVQCMYSA